MLCKNCGKEINNDASFCPYCGAAANAGNAVNNTSALNIALKKNKRRKYTCFIVIIAILVLIFPIKNSIEKAVVKSAAEDYLQMVKDGPNEETMDEIIVQLLYGVTGSETLTNLLHGQITGEDVRDIYDAVMLHMGYQVKNVERVESGHYRITVRIENMNNTIVASEAGKRFLERYTEGNIIDAIMLAKNDLSSDKSQTIAGFLVEASDYLYMNDKTHSMVTGIHIIDVSKSDDGWKFSFDKGVDAFIFDCAGMPY